ncbi:MOSC domain-containing protein [Lichenicola sp.]|uniref:MOSC domain-containing protein n=1 Tax=Lichenicola sp. TaxID=2804529 RepID=UPI003AFF7F12
MVTTLLIADSGDFVGRKVACLSLTFGGLHADRHAGNTRRADARTPWHPRGTPIANTRQLSLVSLEECEEIAAALGLATLDPALLGPNLVLQGIASLSLLPPATRLQFPSGATIFITEQNVPCRHPGARIAAAHGDSRLAGAFGRASTGRRGLLALVEREGVVQAGDSVRTVPLRTARPHLPRVKS